MASSFFCTTDAQSNVLSICCVTHCSSDLLHACVPVGSSASMQASTENTVPTEELSDNLDTAAARGHRQQLWWGHHHRRPPPPPPPSPPPPLTPPPTPSPTSAPTPAPYPTPYTSDSINDPLLKKAAGRDLRDLRAAAWHAENVGKDCHELVNVDSGGDATGYKVSPGACINMKNELQPMTFPLQILKCLAHHGMNTDGQARCMGMM